MKKAVFLLIVFIASCADPKTNLIDLENAYYDSMFTDQKMADSINRRNLSDTNLTLDQKAQINDKNQTRVCLFKQLKDAIAEELKNY